MLMEEQLRHRLRRLMVENNLSQKELAKKAGLTEATLSRYLSGTRIPHSEIIGRLASILNTTSDYLLGIEKEPPKAYIELSTLIQERKKELTGEEKMRLITLLSKED